ncbi:uncharacterized protein LOC108912953 [Anoplophora glabripennis]|uniref:uncharacterized protein LOC108912953 n=1 Tax=Anoplophora glabripennis TaxID=217634 RepID=UPI000873B062|nr:uncharacterized protein LOC108912953 [Anoplophora glabripennis]XP_018573900.1 uncharacterized protein LOC108912953 [Anoplophora glabripennis]
MPIIKKIITKEEGLRPVLVDFQNSKINSNEGDNVKSSLYKSGDGKTVVGVTNGNMLYTGVIDTENDLYNNFLLVHNKNTGKVRLIQVDCCTVSPLLDKKSNLMDVSIATTASSVSELNKQFGSKKTKRSTEQQERLKMNINTVKEQLEKTITDIKVDEVNTNFATSNENDSLYRPKINRDASTIDQVYNVEDIVPKSVLESLGNEAKTISEGGDLDDYSLTSFASTNISEIVTSSNETKIYKIAVFLYINYLIKFMNTPMKSITKKFVVCDKSPEVNSHILDNYSFITGTHHRNRPLSMKDKALCSILVLAAVAGNYQVNVETLSKDFKIGIKKVLEISRVLAFNISGKNRTVVTLKLPLPEPVSLSFKRKRK